VVKEQLQLIALGVQPVLLTQVWLIALLLSVHVLLMLNVLLEPPTTVQQPLIPSLHSAHLLLQEPLVQLDKPAGAALPTVILALLTLIIAF
jgi:hypothetical protein